MQYFKEDSCIASTAAVIDILDYFGIKVRPLTVEVAIYNPAMVEKIKEHGFPKDIETTYKWEKENGSWVVGCGFYHSELDPRFVKKEKGWPGHLIAVGSDFMIDISLDQANRPHRNMNLGPVWLGDEHCEIKISEFIGGETGFPVTLNGCLLMYKARLKDLSFKQSNDWKFFQRRQETVYEVVKKIEMARELW